MIPKGFTFFFWAAGTWWIPLLIILGIWRHLIQKEPVPVFLRKATIILTGPWYSSLLLKAANWGASYL